VITTVAGTEFSFPPTPLASLETPLGRLADLVVDTKGSVYVSDSENNRVFGLTPGGILTVIAGNGIEGFSGDGGPATNASIRGQLGAGLLR